MLFEDTRRRHARRAAPLRSTVVALAVVPLAACGTSGDGPDGGVASTGVTVEVIALDNSFRPGELEIAAGTEVRWEHRGRNDHNVLPADGSTTWGAPTEDFPPGGEYTVVFDTPGRYPYYCSIHGTEDIGMVGTVVVLPPGA